MERNIEERNIEQRSIALKVEARGTSPSWSDQGGGSEVEAEELR